MVIALVSLMWLAAKATTLGKSRKITTWKWSGTILVERERMDNRV